MSLSLKLPRTYRPLKRFKDIQRYDFMNIGFKGSVDLARTPEDFEGLVFNGFSIDDLTYCGITKAKIDQKYSRFLSFIQTPGI